MVGTTGATLPGVQISGRLDKILRCPPAGPAQGMRIEGDSEMPPKELGQKGIAMQDFTKSRKHEPL
jgi:hypothetical protein